MPHSPCSGAMSHSLCCSPAPAKTSCTYLASLPPSMCRPRLSTGASSFGRASFRSDINDRIVLNVGGARFEVMRRTLKRFPATRLSRLSEEHSNYNAVLHEWFFDRHPGIFPMILSFYQTGKLHYPANVCVAVFEEELRYWNIESASVEQCCLSRYTKHKTMQDMLEILKRLDPDVDEKPSEAEIAKRFGWEDDYLAGRHNQWQETKPKLWSLFEEPHSSKSAKVIAMITVFFICVSISVFCLKTQPRFRIPHVKCTNISTISTLRNRIDENAVSPWQQVCIVDGLDHEEGFFFYLELVCTIWFTFEFIVRFMVCPSKVEYWQQALTWIDFLATFSFYVDVIMDDFGNYSQGMDRVLQFISAMRRFVRPVKLLRLFKLTHVSSGLKILVHTLRASAKELLLLTFVMFIVAVVFSAFMYYAERSHVNSENRFKSIIVSLFWAINTMTTVGQCAETPKTPFGMLVGSICAVAGVVTVALPVPIIVNKFSIVYAITRLRTTMVKKRRRMTRTNAIRRRRIRRRSGVGVCITGPDGGDSSPSYGTIQSIARRFTPRLSISREHISVRKTASLILEAFTRGHHRDPTETVIHGSLRLRTLRRQHGNKVKHSLQHQSHSLGVEENYEPLHAESERDHLTIPESSLEHLKIT